MRQYQGLARGPEGPLIRVVRGVSPIIYKGIRFFDVTPDPLIWEVCYVTQTFKVEDFVT
jgi:hypothetical protein